MPPIARLHAWCRRVFADPEWQKRRFLAVLAGPLLAILAGCLTLNKPGGWFISLSYDLPFLMHRAGGSDKICIVYLDKFDAGLLDRSVQAPLLKKIGAAGARMVLYDVVFDQRSKDEAIDSEFAAAMRQFRGVNESGPPLPDAQQRTILLAAGRDTFVRSGAVGEVLLAPTDALLDAADDFGLTAQVVGDGYTARQLNTGTAADASLTWKAAVAAGTPLEESQRLTARWINYAGPPPDADDPDASPAFRTVSASDVMAGAEGVFQK